MCVYMCVRVCKENSFPGDLPPAPGAPTVMAEPLSRAEGVVLSAAGENGSEQASVHQQISE